MSELGNYASLMAWSFLPGMATDWLHKTYYSFRYAKNSPSKPQPHTDRYNLHNRRIYVLVILSYLAYSLFEVVTSLPSNHYKLLSMDPVDFSQRELKTNFRRLSLQYHPDKNVGDDEAERMFIKTRIAYEILNDPVRRLAYDKFGQSVATCSTCRTHRDFVYAAYPSYLSFYVGTGVVLLLLNILSKGQFARYWRFTSFLCLASLELSMLLRPRNPLPFQFLLWSFTTREQIQILHNVFISFFMALSHVGPVIFLEERRSVRQVLEKLEKISLANENHALGSFKALLKPFAHNSEAETLLRRRMEKIMVESSYQKDSEYVASKNRARGGLRKSK